MTSKERLEAALAGVKAGRVGWAPEINDVFTEHYIRRYRAGELKALGPIDEYNALAYARINQLVGGDTLLRVKPWKMLYDGVVFGKVEEGDETVETIETPAGKLSSRIRREPEAATSFRYEFFVKGPADYPVWADFVARTRYVPDYDAVANAQRKLGDAGIVSLDVPATPYMDFVMWHAGVEPLMYQVFDHERELTALFEVQHARNLEAYRIAAACPFGRIVRPMEDTSQMLSSPDAFRKFIRPHMQAYADVVHAHGKLFLPHMCGHLKDMLPILKDVDIDGIEAITPPPTGNCPVKLARKVLGSTRVLIGGIDATRFSLSPPGEFERAVAEVLSDMKGDPRFVLGDEEIQISARWENIEITSRLLEKTASG